MILHHFVVNETNYNNFIMGSRVIGIEFGASIFSWIKSVCVLKNVINATKDSMILYYYVHYLISHYLPHDLQSTPTRVINKTVLILHDIFLYLSLNPYISNVSNLYNLDQNLSLACPTICNHMFFRSKVGL